MVNSFLSISRWLEGLNVSLGGGGGACKLLIIKEVGISLWNCKVPNINEGFEPV